VVAEEEEAAAAVSSKGRAKTASSLLPRQVSENSIYRKLSE
jgi:hypothetical protein